MKLILAASFWLLGGAYLSSLFGKFMKECDDAQEAAWRDYVEEHE